MITSAIQEPEAQPEAVEGVDGLVMQSDGQDGVLVSQPPKIKLKERRGEEGRVLTLRPGYMYREANWEIGRAAERAKVKVKLFKPRDRFTAWRKTVIRKAKNAERRGLGRKVKK